MTVGERRPTWSIGRRWPGWSCSRGCPKPALEAIAAFFRERNYSDGERSSSLRRAVFRMDLPLLLGFGPADGPRLGHSRNPLTIGVLETPGAGVRLFHGHRTGLSRGQLGRSGHPRQGRGRPGSGFPGLPRVEPGRRLHRDEAGGRVVSRRLAALRRDAAGDHYRLRETGGHDGRELRREHDGHRRRFRTGPPIDRTPTSMLLWAEADRCPSDGSSNGSSISPCGASSS